MAEEWEQNVAWFTNRYNLGSPTQFIRHPPLPTILHMLRARQEGII